MVLWLSGHEMTASVAGHQPMAMEPPPAPLEPSLALYERIRMLERSNVALEHFACDASHDLNEPLRVMAHLTERLAVTTGGVLDEEGQRLLAGIVDGVDRMRSLIGDLLECSRAGGKPVQHDAVDCESVFEDTLHLLEESIAEKGATVTQGELPIIDANRCQIGQIFQNLISNALKFARDDSPLRVHVAARRQNGAWCFTVADNGIGIDPDRAEEVFELFRSLHPRDAYAGTGIGLSICKRIVADYDGRIWVESAPGGGSIFCFTIPDSRGNGHSTSPLRIASATAAARSDTPSFW
jgi:light-regulated signal transduction histidine kinase (bacteriophytochrome)